MLRNYKELTAWQRAYGLCLEVYRLTAEFPKEEKYGLVSQIRRAAVSVPSNIAEGYGRRTTGEYLQSLHVAYASLCELETQVLLVSDLGFLKLEPSRKLKEDVGDVERLLKALIRSLEQKRSAPEH
ncbi:MAG: four helix bundle protein [candidate division WOR-3 bacterium]